MKLSSFIVAALVLLAGARADANLFEATVSAESITIADTITLSVTLEHDGTSALESYRQPSMPDFDILRAEQGVPSTVWMNINGHQSVKVTEEHAYLLRPKKKGVLTIGAAIARFNGQEMKTRTFTIRVGGIPKNMISTTPQGTVVAPLTTPSAMRANADTYVEAVVDRPKVYVGEQINATWRLWAATRLMGFRSLAEPKNENFWTEDLTPQRKSWDRQIANGREYGVMLLLEHALFPLKAGKFTISPLKLELTTERSMFSGTASEVSQSNALEIDVRPLPSDGRPANFPSTNVGHFELKAAVDRTRIAAGDAVSFKLTISGTGNIHGVKPPKLTDRVDGPDGWRAYDPTVKENIERGSEIRGEKVLTYLLMPQKGGRLTIPALELTYFDPKTARYETTRTGALEVDVEGDPKRVEQSTSGNASENVLSRQIRPIHNRTSLRTHLGARMFENARMRVILLATPPLIWLLVLIVDVLRRRLARDTPRSRRRRARANARRRLRVAEYNIKAQRPPAFFAECARAIYEHLEFRLRAKVESYTLSELRGHLVKQGFSPETAEAIAQELENCDFARFAPSASGPGEMRAALRRVKNLLGFIEKERLASEKEAA